MSTLTINGVVIHTCYVFPPVPCRDYDWSAVTDDYDGPGDLIGYGRTEQAAIDDLVDKLIERDIEVAERVKNPRGSTLVRSATNLDFTTPAAPATPQDYTWDMEQPK